MPVLSFPGHGKFIGSIGEIHMHQNVIGSTFFQKRSAGSVYLDHLSVQGSGIGNGKKEQKEFPFFLCIFSCSAEIAPPEIPLHIFFRSGKKSRCKKKKEKTLEKGKKFFFHFSSFFSQVQ